VGVAAIHGQAVCDDVSAVEPNERRGEPRDGDSRDADHVADLSGLHKGGGYPVERRNAVGPGLDRFARIGAPSQVVPCYAPRRNGTGAAHSH
jgi:hypothetical protein